jgi:hypothetical protein
MMIPHLCKKYHNLLTWIIIIRANWISTCLSVGTDCLFCGCRLISIYSYSIVDLGGLADHHLPPHLICKSNTLHFNSMDLSVWLKSVKTCSNLFTLLPWQLTHYLTILFSKPLKFTPKIFLNKMLSRKILNLQEHSICWIENF